MKKLIKNVAAATVISAVFASSAFAMTSTSASVRQALFDAHVHADGVRVSVEDGVATLSGNLNDNAARTRAEQVVLKQAGITDVINLVTGN